MQELVYYLVAYFAACFALGAIVFWGTDKILGRKK